MPRLAVRFVLLMRAVVEVLVGEVQHRIVEVEGGAEGAGTALVGSLEAEIHTVEPESTESELQ